MSKATKIPATLDQMRKFSAIEAKPASDSREDFEYALSIFKSIVQKERILSLYKEKQRYEKPSVKKRRKKIEALQRAKEEKVKDGE